MMIKTPIFWVLALMVSALAFTSGAVWAAWETDTDSLSLVAQTAPCDELRTELLTDPLSVGYAAMTNFQAAQAINTVGLTGETVDVAFIDAQGMQAEVVASEYLLLTAPERDLWSTLINAGTLEVRDPEIRGQVIAIWGSGTTTRSNLAALQTRSASRAEALWGDGVTVNDQQVEEARDLNCV